MPRGHWYIPPKREAIALLYPDTASGELFNLSILSTHLSKRGVSCDGRARAIHPKHHDADSLEAGLGCINTDTTGSIIPTEFITMG